MKRIAVLGSTGSIGLSTLNVVRALKGSVEITALSADSSVKILAAQARRLRPRVIAVGNARLASEARRVVPAATKVVYGQDGLRDIVGRRDVDLVVFAISGTACLVPLIDAIRNRKEIALANKESIVSAGEIIMPLAKRHGVTIVPIDSEHSAIFQCLGGKREFLSKIILTASGGPLRAIAQKRFDRLPRDFVIRHPTWKMGRKISVDSATMMNKGLEVIEACHLFGLSEDRVEVVVHPEAIVHSMVEFIDGTVLGAMSKPDMRLPIQYALTFPNRAPSRIGSVDFCKLGKLSFAKPDYKKFPCLALARRAIRSGGCLPAVLNAADEEAVKLYLERRIQLSEIPRVIEEVMSAHKDRYHEALSLRGILDAESWAKEEVRGMCCQ